MRAAVIGDIHFNIEYKHISMREPILKVLNKIIDNFEQFNIPDFVFFLGDITDNPEIKMEEIIDIVRLFRRFQSLIFSGTKIRVICGNHDRKVLSNSNKNVFDLLKTIFYYDDKIKFIDKYFFEDITDRKDKKIKRLMYLPYPTGKVFEGDMEEFYGLFIKDNTKRIDKVFAFTHLNTKDGKYHKDSSLDYSSKYNCIPESLIREEKVETIFNGHYHIQQNIGKIVMPGSVITTKFSDDVDKFYIEATL